LKASSYGTDSKSKQRTRELIDLVQSLLIWFAQHARDLPWRKTIDPYAIWISEVMLQQTQVTTVIPYWRRWMEHLPTIEALAGAKLERVLKLWEGLGYYTRARHIREAAKIIVRQHDGHFPSQFDDVLALPGIGRYTAGAICSIAFNQPTPILDGNVTRVLSRIFGIRGKVWDKTVQERLWNHAQSLVSLAGLKIADLARPCARLNEALMELGAIICTPRNPRCGSCPVRKLCSASQNDWIDRIPNLGSRPAAQPRYFIRCSTSRTLSRAATSRRRCKRIALGISKH
jgi:A/G-specific adenine glycosylase